MNNSRKDIASNAEDSQNVLKVFDRLDVGPVKVERKRLVAPYRVRQNGAEERTELIYTYEESVFDPREPASRNLAEMIAAQVALNYGLFCDKIVFHGQFHDTDRRFLRDMAENTSREIYVKKFLEPNPFLTGDAANLPPVRQERYLKARLVFPQRLRGAYVGASQTWETDPNRHCILSSGGKDSLLSFGLLDELGLEAHPIYVNESGRHWFTALNAYRHFRDNIPNTARVWVNADRVFSWMLRRMPFIRKDFADVRSDEYPVRLWTVAVFLFGVLPLLRKRGIGRLVIGDEFDTSRRKTFEGITHYDALYDQSIWFDTAMSRYFQRKGWGVSQFSVLRPLSELLIEKILVKRYPHLQEHQTSCHATHKEGDRIKPCGKCEKCRRIVGILTALNEDPARCGYTPEQIESCLAALDEKGLYTQEAAELGQLFHLLAQTGRLSMAADDLKKIKDHPETVQLRFDARVSPVHGIPDKLRGPLYGIYMNYAEGAVERRGSGSSWRPCDPFAHPDMTAPYPFEAEAKGASPTKESEAGAATFVWGELCWPDAAERFRTVDTALLPVGAIEQHGPHLPLDTDAFDAEYLSRKVAEACSDPKPLVLPLIAYGVSYHHEDFKGTISIGNDTLSKLVYDIGISLSKNGIRKLVIINGHGGNAPSLNFAAQMINRDARIFVCVDTGETSDVDIDRLVETPNDVHAGEIETSTSMAIRPHLVRTDRVQKEVPEFSSRYLNFTSKRGVSWYAHTHKISASGVMGDPTKASAEKGEKMWELMISHLVAFVEQLKAMTLKEIYHRRY